MDNKIFNYSISNPPYQKRNYSNTNSMQVYPRFWFNSNHISDKTIMIFPLGWQLSVGNASGSTKHKFMRSDNRIVFVDNYYEDKSSPIRIFNGVGTRGVNIILTDNNYYNNGLVKFFEYSVYKEDKNLKDQKHWSKTTDIIFNKINDFMVDNNMSVVKDIVSSSHSFGVKNYMIKKDREDNIYFNDNYVKNSFKVLCLVESCDHKFLYVDKSAPFLKDVGFNKYKSVFPRTGAWRMWRYCRVLNPGELISDTFLCVNFNTYEEAYNYNSYIKTYFFRFILTETAPAHNVSKHTHKNIPDLKNIVNPRTGLTGYHSSWTDNDLKLLFKDYLSDNDWDYIKEVALKSDNYRME